MEDIIEEPSVALQAKLVEDCPTQDIRKRILVKSYELSDKYSRYDVSMC